MITSIIANTLVLTALWRTPTLRSPSLTLLCSLAVSDFLVGIVVQPLYVINQIAKVRVYPKLRITDRNDSILVMRYRDYKTTYTPYI